MMINSNRTSWNNLSNDVLYHIINLIPSPKTLRSLSCVERRCHPPCSARLNKTMSTILHAAARIGDTHRISCLFYRWRIPVMLKDKHGGTILKTALVSRQLDTVQWLMQPLSRWGEYLPLSSGAFAPSLRTEAIEVQPRLLPEDYCRRMMALDGIPALRNAATGGDIDLLDRLLPMLPSFSYKYKYDEISREFMMEMRDALIQFTATNQNNNGGDILRKTLFAAINIDRRLRYSDIENTFGYFEEEKIEELFARDQVQPQRQVKELFGWRFDQFDQGTVPEGLFFNVSLRVLVGLGRIDLVDWLFNRWDVFYDSYQGETLADIVVISPWRWHDVEKMFEIPYDCESQNRENRQNSLNFSIALKCWRNREPPPWFWTSETSEENINQLYTYQSSQRSCDITVLSILLKAAVAYLSKEENSIHSWQDLEITKKTLALVEPATDHTQMLDYLSNNNHGRPSLALLACRGQLWALDWLLLQTDFTLEMTTASVPEDLRFLLHDTVPWLTPNLEKHLPIGSVLAAVCASYGAVAMLEKLSRINAKYLRMRFYRGRTLLHLTARNRQRVTTIWLMENGYHDLLRCRSRGKPLEMKPYRHSKTLCSRRCSAVTPLLDAVAGGDPEIIQYLLECGGAVGEPIVGVTRGSLWEDIALDSNCDAVRRVAIETRKERILDVIVPSLLRDGAPIADIQNLMMLEGVSIYGELRYIRKLLHAAMIGKREDFLRFMYESNGGAPPYINQGIIGYAGYDTKCHTHVDICREVFSASDASMSRINLVIDELKSKSESARDCSMEVHKLSRQLERLVTKGSTVEMIVEVVTQIGVLLQDDNQTEIDCDQTITVYGMTLKANHFHDGKDLKFTVKNIGSFELFTTCAMYGYLHLLNWLLQGKQPPNLMQIGNALVDCIKWGGQTLSVEFLSQHLEAKGVDLNAIQQINQDHNSNQIGVLEYAMEGIVLSHRYSKDDENNDRINSSWDSARWLAKHTKAQLRTNSFPDILCDYEISIGIDYEKRENQCFVLKFTRFCVETLYASWSDVGSQKIRGGTKEEGRTAIQLLLNGGWIEAVSWLAQEHGASLQGLIVEKTRFLSHEKKEKYCNQLQQLQEQQQAAWVCVGVL